EKPAVISAEIKSVIQDGEFLGPGTVGRGFYQIVQVGIDIGHARRPDAIVSPKLAASTLIISGEIEGAVEERKCRRGGVVAEGHARFINMGLVINVGDEGHVCAVVFPEFATGI